MATETEPIYKFVQEVFTCNDLLYNVVLTPELYGEEDGLDFTGNYFGILIHPEKGTFNFKLTEDDFIKWKMQLLFPYEESSAVLELVDDVDAERIELERVEVPQMMVVPAGDIEEITPPLSWMNDRALIEALDRIIQKSRNPGL